MNGQIIGRYNWCNVMVDIRTGYLFCCIRLFEGNIIDFTPFRPSNYCPSTIVIDNINCCNNAIKEGLKISVLIELTPYDFFRKSFFTKTLVNLWLQNCVAMTGVSSLCWILIFKLQLITILLNLLPDWKHPHPVCCLSRSWILFLSQK